MSNETWAAIIGSLVGSLVGGAIAAGLQWLAQRNSKRERDQGLAYSLLFKVSQIYSHLRTLDGHVEAAFANATPGDSPWGLMQPIPNLPAHVTFSTDEMALTFSMKDDGVMNKLLSMDEKHNATLALLEFYGDKRLELTNIVQPLMLDGNVGTIDTAQLDLSTQTRIVALDGTVESVRKYLHSDVGTALNVLQQLAGLFNSQLNVGFTAIPKPAALTQSASEVASGVTAPQQS